MKKNVRTFALMILLASLSLWGCKKKEAADLTGIHTSQAETLEETQSQESGSTKASSDSESLKESNTSESKGSNVSEALSVKAKTATEKTGKTSIEYPILSNLRDQSLTDTVNNLLKEKATAILTGWDLDPEKDSVSIQCEQLYLDKDKAIFNFRGEVFADGAAHPNTVWYAVSVNLNKGTLIGLTDYADSDSIAEYLSSGDFVLTDGSEEAKESIKSTDKATWQSIFENCDFTSVTGDDFPSAFSYEKDGDIYLIVPVTHAAGDYALVKYSPETK